MTPAAAPDANLDPTSLEMKAIAQFVCDDETLRPSMRTIWEYRSQGGVSHMATDGHTLVLRRAGTHTTMAPADIAKLAYRPMTGALGSGPPGWGSVMSVPEVSADFKNGIRRGIDTEYMARVAVVERAAGKRAAERYVPEPRESKKVVSLRKRALTALCASWAIWGDALDPWVWTIDAGDVH